MIERLKAFCNKYAAATLIGFLLIGSVNAQTTYTSIATPYQWTNGGAFTRPLGIAKDTFAITGTRRDSAHIASKGDQIYLWSTTFYKWVATGTTYTAGYGTQLNNNAFSVDTFQLTTRPWLYKVVDSVGGASTLHSVTTRGSTTTNKITVGGMTANGTVAASGGIARLGFYNGTLNATANNDTLVGLDFRNTFNTNGFSNVQTYTMRTAGNVYFGGPGTFNLGSNIFYITYGAIPGFSGSFPRVGTADNIPYSFIVNTLPQITLTNGAVVVGGVSGPNYASRGNYQFQVLGNGVVYSEGNYSGSGSGNPFTNVILKPTINQTGSNTDTVAAVDYNPTLTSLQGYHFGLRIRKGINYFGEVPNTTASGVTFPVLESGLLKHYTLTQMQSVMGGGAPTGGGTQFNNSDSSFKFAGDTLKFRDYVNVKSFGAKGDGSTSDATAFLNAIATGRPVFVPEGTYIINSNLTLWDGQMIFGVGNKSVLKTTTLNGRILTVGNGSTVRHLKFIGTGKTGADFQTGVFCYDKINWSVENCTFVSIAGAPQQNGGGGIYVTQLGASNTEGGRIMNCRADSCNGGFVFASRGEYTAVSNIQATNSNVGVCIGAGNITVTGGIIEKNVVGLKLIDGTNDSHGAAVGVLINHNTTNLNADLQDQGFAFTNCKFYSGNISISNSTGITFSQCDFLGGSITLTANAKLYRSLCRVPLSPTANAMTKTVASGEDFTEVNNMDF